MLQRAIKLVMLFLVVNFLIFSFFSSHTLSGDIPASGSYLPKFQLEAPISENDRIYLGIESLKTFSIDQIKCMFMLIEIVGVYCPRCHIQTPLFNKLFYRIKKNTSISKRLKMFAITVGANQTETDYLKKEFNIPYPVIKDLKFEIHKLLGEPRTPFTMIVTRNRNVVFAHLGIIHDIDKFYLKLKNLVQ